MVTAFGSARAQNVAAGIHTGFSMAVQKGNAFLGVPVGLNAEWAYDTKHSFSGKAQFNIGVGNDGVNYFYIAPEYKYHITGESLDGFYIGAYMGFGGGSGTGYISIGALSGFSLPIGKSFNLESHVQIGYGNFTAASVSVFHIVPTIGGRWAF